MLFRYRLVLAKANVLSRAIGFLEKLEENCNPPFQLKNVKMSHSRIKNDVLTDYELIRDTLEMALTHAYIQS